LADTSGANVPGGHSDASRQAYHRLSG
jgi:hypothetical protein